MNELVKANVNDENGIIIKIDKSISIIFFNIWIKSISAIVSFYNENMSNDIILSLESSNDHRILQIDIYKKIDYKKIGVVGLVNVGLEDNYYKYIRYAHRNIEDIDKWTLILAKITLYAYSYMCGFENNKETLYNALCKLIRTA